MEEKACNLHHYETDQICEQNNSESDHFLRHTNTTIRLEIKLSIHSTPYQVSQRHIIFLWRVCYT